MKPAAAQPAANQSDLLDQLLAESPVRSFWLLRHFTPLSTAVQVALDFLCVFLALGLAYRVYRVLGLGTRVSYPSDIYLLVSAAVAVTFVLLLERYGIYRPGSSLLYIRETESIVRAACWSTAVFFVVGYMFLRFAPSRMILMLGFTLVLLLVISQRIVYYGFLRKLHLLGYGVDRVLIHGASEPGVQVFRKLVQSLRAGLVPVAFVDRDPSLRGKRIYENFYTRRKFLVVVGTDAELEEILSRLRITRLIMADLTASDPEFQRIYNVCEKCGVRVSFVPVGYQPILHQVSYQDLDGTMLAEIRSIQESNVYRVTKRLLDLVLGGLMLLLAGPFMMVIAAAIWMADGRPVIFSQDRVGQFGKKFRMFKFRTMYRDSPPYAPTPKDSDDPRITKVGRFLRRTSLDELPQLLNVFRGEMSLVGPRPEQPFIVEQYNPVQRERLLVKPGITGLWQISADRAFEIHENIDYDLYYIRNRSIMLDLVILLHTVIFAIRGTGAF